MSSEHGVVFASLVILAFVVQVYNYYELGRDRVNHYTWLFVLGCFVITESMVALAVSYWYFLYVVLNLWGIYNLLRGKQ